jgi:hypothetical protein
VTPPGYVHEYGETKATRIRARSYRGLRPFFAFPRDAMTGA